jgi:hypothetical protein
VSRSLELFLYGHAEKTQRAPTHGQPTFSSFAVRPVSYHCVSKAGQITRTTRGGTWTPTGVHRSFPRPLTESPNGATTERNLAPIRQNTLPPRRHRGLPRLTEREIRGESQGRLSRAVASKSVLRSEPYDPWRAWRLGGSRIALWGQMSLPKRATIVSRTVCFLHASRVPALDSAMVASVMNLRGIFNGFSVGTAP